MKVQMVCWDTSDNDDTWNTKRYPADETVRQQTVCNVYKYGLLNLNNDNSKKIKKIQLESWELFLNG